MYTSCQGNTIDSKCLLVDLNNVCILCQKGFQLNIANVCEEVIFPLCLDNNS